MTDRSTDTDPRRTPEAASERDVRPVVERPRSGLSGTAIAVGAVAAGLLLFSVLDARRRSTSAPALSTRRTDAPVSAAPPPPLYLPAPITPSALVETPLPLPVAPSPASLPTRPQAITPSPAPVAYPPQPSLPPAAPLPQRNVGGATLVVDTSQGSAGTGGTPNVATGPLSAPGAAATERVRAGVFANRATTVPQGTLIPAVLETAFDSTRPGFARALVQRDVRGFDGTQVLIPRGSRLIGEYAADITAGQKRAVVNWSRLIRPDGVTIAIGSPAADPVGRGGVRAQVNSHFFERFAGAILQSTLDVGVNLASRSNNGSVIVALPNSTQGFGGAITRPTEIRPTLRVAQGTSISVFVARDLDFTDAAAGR